MNLMKHRIPHPLSNHEYFFYKDLYYPGKATFTEWYRAILLGPRKMWNLQVNTSIRHLKKEFTRDSVDFVMDSCKMMNSFSSSHFQRLKAKTIQSSINKREVKNSDRYGEKKTDHIRLNSLVLDLDNILQCLQYERLLSPGNTRHSSRKISFKKI